jgi:hypothetical protein
MVNPRNTINDPEAFYLQIKSLVQTLPSLRSVTDDYQLIPETKIWLGRLYALVEQSGELVDCFTLRLNGPKLIETHISGVKAVREISAILYRTLARAELAAPASAQGAFVAVGDHFDVFRAVKDIFGNAQHELLIIDPYLDEVVLTDFLPLANEGVKIRLLADEAALKQSLKPATERWIGQHGLNRPLETKVASARSLHDRLIFVDGKAAWLLTQSLKDFAARAPGTIQRTDAELARLKIVAYEAIWLSAEVI